MDAEVRRDGSGAERGSGSPDLPGIEAVEQRIRAGERLGAADGLALFASDDLARLGGLAHAARTRVNGDAGHFALVRPLSVAAAAPAGAGGEATEEEHAAAVVRLAQEGGTDGLVELRLDAAGCPAGRFLPLLRALRAALPDGVALTGCTAADVRRFAAESGTDADAADGIEGVLARLADAGLESLAGDDAGVFDPGVRAHFPGLPAWEEWAQVHRAAHARGLSSVCTLLLGHTEEPAHVVDHLLRLRALQDETGGFREFAPLLHEDGAGHTAGRSGGPAPRTVTGAETFKTFAVCRLLLDNVAHIAVDRAAFGDQTAQLTLQFGADELAGPVAEARGAAAPDAPGRDELVELIRDAGFRPVERTAGYGTVHAYDGPDPDRREAPQPMRV